MSKNKIYDSKDQLFSPFTNQCKLKMRSFKNSNLVFINCFEKHKSGRKNVYYHYRNSEKKKFHYCFVMHRNFTKKNIYKKKI